MMRRYLLILAGPVLVVFLPLAPLSILFEPLSGDLTRIGAYAERDFGWNAPQPVIHINANGGSISKPEVLVLGDSFSRSNEWQSVLATKASAATLSFHYTQIGCIPNWIEYALSQQSARTVVIEAVERDFIRDFIDLQECRSDRPIPFELSPAESAAERVKWPPKLRLEYAYRTAFHTVEMNFSNNRLTAGSVVNAPLKSNCAKFSNRRADRLLYFGADEAKSRWQQDDIDRAISNVRRIQRLFEDHGKKFIFIVVPDKSSAYRDCLLNDTDVKAGRQVNITQALIAAGVNTPDLLSVFRAKVNEVVDLYRPNDTHLSEAGFILMAEQIERYFAAIQAMPPARRVVNTGLRLH